MTRDDHAPDDSHGTDETTAPDETRGTDETPAPVETHVPASGDAPVHRCPHCDRAFTTPARVDLHVGLAHYDDCSDAEAAAFETAYAAETPALREYRLKAIAALIALYFGTLMLYAVVT